MNTSGSSYVYASQPAPIQRPKYRAEAAATTQKQTTNIANDPRVKKGLTFTSNHTTPSFKQEQEQTSKTQTIKSSSATTKAKTSDHFKLPSVATLHNTTVVTATRTEVPLHLFLEEHVDPKETSNNYTQTDAFKPLPPPQPYIPAKTGLDVATQVDVDQVFNFDRDINPLLDVIVGKTLEQCMMEVQQETQLDQLAAHTEELNLQFEAEQQNIQLIEQAEMKKYQEKEQLMIQAKQRKEEEYILKQKVAATMFASEFVKELNKHVFSSLQPFFIDVHTKQSEEYLPKVYSQVQTIHTQHKAAEQLLHDLLMASHRAAEEEQKKIFQIRKEQEEAEKKMNVDLYIQVDGESVGPLHLRLDSSIKDVQQQVQQWMSKNKKERVSSLQNSFFSIDLQTPLNPVTKLNELGLNNLATLHLHLDKQNQKNDDNNNDNDDNDD